MPQLYHNRLLQLITTRKDINTKHCLSKERESNAAVTNIIITDMSYMQYSIANSAIKLYLISMFSSKYIQTWYDTIMLFRHVCKSILLIQ